MRTLLLEICLLAWSFAPAIAQVNGQDTPPKRTLATNQKYMGTNEGEDVGTCLVHHNSNVNYEFTVGAILPAKYVAKYDGGKIISMRAPFTENSGAVRMFVCTVTDGTIGGEVLSQEVDSTVAGWNEVKFATPYTISADGKNSLFLGYEIKDCCDCNEDSMYVYKFYTVSECYEGVKCYYKSGHWNNWFKTEYKVNVQCLVEKDGIQEVVDVDVESVRVPQVAKKGGTTKVVFESRNFNQAQAVCNYGISINGKEVATLDNCTVDNNTSTFEKEITVGDDCAEGQKHEVAVYLKSVNGNAPAGDTDDDKAVDSFFSYTKTTQRQYNILETTTATWCPSCFYADSYLKELMAQRDDIVRVSIHEADKYDVAHQSIFGNALPAYAVNRTLFDDESSLYFHITYLGDVVPLLSHRVDEASALCPTFAKIDIETNYDEATRNLTITVKGTGTDYAATLMGDDVLTVYLTEEGLHLTQWSGDEYLDYLHYGVLRKTLNDYIGENEIMWNGDNFENTYTVTLDEEWDESQMHVVAFTHRPCFRNDNIVCDASDLWVGDVNRVAVGGSTTNIKNAISSGKTKSPVAYYTVSGQRLNSPSRGLCIVKFDDGTTKKIWNF